MDARLRLCPMKSRCVVILSSFRWFHSNFDDILGDEKYFYKGVIILLEPVVLNKKDIDGAVKLASNVFNNDMGKCFPVFLSEKNIGNLVGVKDKGEVTALVGLMPAKISIYGHVLKVGLIGSVCTHPDYRGLGLATKILDVMEKKSIEDGLSAFIISGGRGLYRKFGAVDVGRYNTAKVFPIGEDAGVRIADESDIERILSVHAKKPVRFIRNYSDFKDIFLSGRIVTRPSETYIKGNSYCTFSKVLDKFHALEFGGSREDVLTIIKTVTAIKNEDYCVLHFESGFEYPAEETTVLNGTAKIISPSNFFNQMEGYFMERIPKEDYESFKERAMGLDYSELTTIIFGKGNEKLQAEKILPLPLPDYGWDYI